MGTGLFWVCLQGFGTFPVTPYQCCVSPSVLAASSSESEDTVKGTAGGMSRGARPSVWLPYEGSSEVTLGSAFLGDPGSG